MPTSAEVGAAINTIKAIADAIKELGSIPSGHLYARLMGNMDLAAYERIIDILVRGEIIRKQGDLLIWNVQ